MVYIPNVWHCDHDLAVFGEDTDDFHQGRHLDERGELLSGSEENGQQARRTTFKFGVRRRICLGESLANDTLFITTARMPYCWRQTSRRTGQNWEESTARHGHTRAYRPRYLSTCFSQSSTRT